MNARKAKTLLRCCGPGGEDLHDREFRAAARTAGKNSDLEAEFERQQAFDRAAAGLLDDPVPADLAPVLAGYGEKFSALRQRSRFSFHDPAALSVGFSFLVLVGLLLWVFLESMGGFSGKAEVVELAKVGERAGAEHFDALSADAGTLEDWFIIQGFEGFRVPAGFEGFEVVGVRIFNYEGEPVAAAAVTENRSFFYVFAAAPFEVSVKPEGAWQVLEYGEGRVLAIREIGGKCFMVTFGGTKTEMERFLRRAETGASRSL